MRPDTRETTTKSGLVADRVVGRNPPILPVGEQIFGRGAASLTLIRTGIGWHRALLEAATLPKLDEGCGAVLCRADDQHGDLIHAVDMIAQQSW